MLVYAFNELYKKYVYKENVNSEDMRVNTYASTAHLPSTSKDKRELTPIVSLSTARPAPLADFQWLIPLALAILHVDTDSRVFPIGDVPAIARAIPH